MEIGVRVCVTGDAVQDREAELAASQASQMAGLREVELMQGDVAELKEELDRSEGEVGIRDID